MYKYRRFDNDKWFQFGRNQGMGYANVPKLVAPEISLGGNYTIDSDGRYYSTTKVYGYVKKKRHSYQLSILTWHFEFCRVLVLHSKYGVCIAWRVLYIQDKLCGTFPIP